MIYSLSPSHPSGRIKAIASKSVAHRLLICAAFADGDTSILCEEINDDIRATVRCLVAMGATIRREAPFYHVTPIQNLNMTPTLDCGESGSTLRFLLPVAALLGLDASFLMAGRLPLRPLSPLREELERAGVSLSPEGSNPLISSGIAKTSEFSISGSVSSQFISGLLFALAVSGRGGRVHVKGTLESAPYVEMTVGALSSFGVSILWEGNDLTVEKAPHLRSPNELLVEGDWSNAAFPLAMGAIGKNPITVYGLNPNSPQGDRAILWLLSAFGAKVSVDADAVTVSPAPLCGIEIDASQIPDLVPILATVASVAEGRTTIRNAERLRLKESDRLAAVSTVLSTLGARVKETSDSLAIEGVPCLKGGRISSSNDHRIAMSAAAASIVCREPVEIDGAEATAKSYPDFWRDLSALGIPVAEKSSFS